MAPGGPAGLARPGIAIACDADSAAAQNTLPPAVAAQLPKFAGGGPGRAVCADRKGVPQQFKFFVTAKRKWKVKCGKGKKSCVGARINPTEDTRAALKIDTWLECTHPGLPALPAFVHPAAVAAARAAGSSGQCHSLTTSARADVTRRLLAARPAEPTAVLVQIHSHALRTADLFVQLTVAATALYALAHGYRALYYNSESACSAPPDPLPHARLRESVACCHEANTEAGACDQTLNSFGMNCWVDGWFLKPHWFKSLALMDAMRRYSSAKWVVSLDTDAAPRHLGWSIEQYTEWALQSRLDPLCDGEKCWGDQEVRSRGDADIIIAREPYQPAEGMLFAERARVNSGVIALRNTPEGRALAADWWESRGADCRVETPPNVSHGLNRVWGSSDQFALGQHIFRSRRRRFAEVPHIACNSAVGLWFVHAYSRKSRETMALLGELALRHASALVWALCGEREVGHPCEGPPAELAGSMRRVANCSSSKAGSWGFRWLPAALATVEERRLTIPEEARAGRGPGHVDAACADRLSGIVAAELREGSCQKFDRGPGFAAKKAHLLDRAILKETRGKR
eukprot:TRINITY_DN4337_c0_g1_i1.p1 TRINITY_DN4337_c0_g1~~TRINITY_DN4337_c0_g1_i1.p1  ORF type:complete len:639 (+),score=153.96 TRINITY_DN4337_c0_g1_i1:202-1917(+)